MTVGLVRTALAELHRQHASTIRTVYEEWPAGPLAEKTFPAVMFRRGPADWYRDGGIIVQSRLWEPHVYLAVKDDATLAYAENLAIGIAQELGELYTNPDRQYLELGSDCEYAQIIQARQQQNGLADDGLVILIYWGKEYYGLSFDLPIVEKKQ